MPSSTANEACVTTQTHASRIEIHFCPHVLSARPPTVAARLRKRARRRIRVASDVSRRENGSRRFIAFRESRLSRFPGRPDRPRSRRVVTLVARPETRDAAVEKLSEGYVLSDRTFVETMNPVPGDPPRIPFTYWAQRKDRLFLTLECPNAEDPKVHLTDDGVLTFSANAKSDSTEADHHYELKLELLHPINAKDSQIHVGPRRTTMVIAKTEEVSGRRDVSSPFFSTHARFGVSVSFFASRATGGVPRRHLARPPRAPIPALTETHPLRAGKRPFGNGAPFLARRTRVRTGRVCCARRRKTRTSKPTSTSGWTRMRKKKPTAPTRSTCPPWSP